MKKIKTSVKAAEKIKQDKAAVKAFRHDVAKLKKKGLLDKKYDARSVSPTKYLKSQIKKFGDVLAGEAQPVKVSKAKVKYYEEQGYKVKSGRVIVPVAENEKVYSTHGDFRVKASGEFGSITRYDLGLPKKDILSWKKALLEKQTRLKEGERIYFQLFGHNSYQSFQNFQQMLDYLDYYPSFNAAENDKIKNQQQYVENVVIFKVDRGSKPPPEIVDEELQQQIRERRAEKRQLWIGRMTPERQKKYKETRRESAAKQRAKRTPEQIERDKEAARKRAQKSYNERTGKK